MGTHSLICHRDTPPLAVRGITVVVEGAQLRWSVTGGEALVVPPRKPAPARTDGLWQTTCFELFLMDAHGSYREFNFAPSGDWAAYGFTGYRAGMADLALDTGPQIAVDQATFSQTVTLCPGVFIGATHIGLTAVIEEKGGHKSYWALAHGEGRPDFHSPSCFIALAGAAGKP